jgi:hypothetical protein
MMNPDGSSLRVEMRFSTGQLRNRYIRTVQISLSTIGESVHDILQQIVVMTGITLFCTDHPSNAISATPPVAFYNFAMSSV